MATPDELHNKFHSSNSFKKEMQKALSNYLLLCQQAHYSDLSIIEPNILSKYESNRLPFDVYFFFAAYQPTDQKLYDKLVMHFITKMPKPKSQYSIIYVNDEENGSSNKFTEFKNFFTVLPLEYYTHLQRIYLLKPSLRNKAAKYFTFHTNTIPKYINNRVTEIHSIENLCENIDLKRHEVFQHLPQKIRDSFHKEEEELHEIQEKQMYEAKKVTTQPVQIPLMPIQQYEKNERGVPQILELLLCYFRQNEEGLLEEGIFRKSVNIEEQTQIMERLAHQQYNCIESITNPHIAANVIKRFFAKLATPVVPYKQFDELMKGPLSIDKIIKVIQQIESENITKLLSLILLIEFLKNQVIPKTSSNKMTAQNVAICFAPCLMWAEQRSIKDIVYASKSVQVMMMMLDNFQLIFGNQKRQEKLFRDSYMNQKVKFIEQSKYDETTGNNDSQYDSENILDYKMPTFGSLILQQTVSYLEEDNERQNLMETGRSFQKTESKFCEDSKIKGMKSTNDEIQGDQSKASPKDSGPQEKQQHTGTYQILQLSIPQTTKVQSCVESIIMMNEDQESQIKSQDSIQSLHSDP